MLITWGVEKAKAEGVPAYLEASALAKPLYERYGFKQIGNPLELDLRTHGVDLNLKMAKMGILPSKVEL